MATDKIKVAVRVRPFNRRGKYICGSYLPRYWSYCCCCCKSKVVWKLGNSGRKINRSKHGDEARTINRIVEIELLHYDDGVYCEVLLMLPPPTRLYSLWFYPVIGLVALFCSSSFIKTRRTTRNLTQFLYSIPLIIARSGSVGKLPRLGPHFIVSPVDLRSPSWMLFVGVGDSAGEGRKGQDIGHSRLKNIGSSLIFGDVLG